MRRVLTAFLAVMSICSCTTISSLIHDDEVVAKVGSYKLYRSEVDAFIPDMISAEDSANLALQYINSWATDILYLEVAEQQLDKQELDMTQELETYRRSLVKFRYEQRYINDRLDTLITDDQIREYYEAHQEDFTLERPVLKVRFVDVMKDSQKKNEIMRMMSSSDYTDHLVVDTLARAYALKYFDRSDEWMDAEELARSFGTGYREMLSNLWGNEIRIEPADRGDILYAYVCDIQRSGTAPLEYSAPRIRDIILSNRKHELVKSLEQDLLDDALDRKEFVIYSDEN